MRLLRLLFSPSGRLSPQPFVVLAAAIYVVGAASHLLTAPDVMGHAGLLPFMAAQALVIWIWFAVHAKRLHDAGRSIALATAAAILYTLSVALMIIIAAAFYGALAGQVPDANTASALGLILFVWVVAILLGAPHYDLGWLVVAFLVLIALLPSALAVAVTLWAASRPSSEEPKA
jgi:uncharacterized membrane protein YhaH (DUF805 family)